MVTKEKKFHYKVFFSLKGIDLKNGACLRDPFIKAARTLSSCAVFWDPSLNGLFGIIAVCCHMGVLLSPIWLKDTLWQEPGSLCRLGSSQRAAEPCWTMIRSSAANYSWDWCSAPRTEPLPSSSFSWALSCFSCLPSDFLWDKASNSSLRAQLHSNLPFSWGDCIRSQKPHRIRWEKIRWEKDPGKEVISHFLLCLD